MTRILPPEDYGPLDEALTRIDSFDWVLFTSANAVDSFMGRLLAGSGDARSLNGVRLCTIGPTTRDRLQRYALRVDVVPAEGRPEGVVRALQGACSLEGARFLLPRANVGREVLAEELRKAGAEVTDVTAYRVLVTEAERDGEPDLYGLLLDRRVDVVTFTSASTVRNLVELLGREQAQDLLRQTTVACIGPVTAEAALQLGIQTNVMPSEYTIPALVESIVRFYQEEKAGEPA
jgi:uroporphyrinogen III methyltransferase/synthase